MFPEGEEREKGPEKILDEIIVETFSNMGKEIINQVQESWRAPGKINPRRNTPRHIVVKLTTIEDRDKNIKRNQGKMTNSMQGNSYQATN